MTVVHGAAHRVDTVRGVVEIRGDRSVDGHEPPLTAVTMGGSSFAVFHRRSFACASARGRRIMWTRVQNIGMSVLMQPCEAQL